MDTKIRIETKQQNLSPAAYAGAYDIRHNSSDKRQPPSDRIRNYLNRVRDPYHFSVGEAKVTIRFCGEKSLSSCLADALNRMAG